MSDTLTGIEREELLASVFDSAYAPVMAYARRRTPQLSDAEDVVAETFVVVWRRLEDMPTHEAERLPWLYGIARRVLANQRRGAARQARLRERMEADAAVQALRAPSPLPAVLEAMGRLRATDQEILRLVAWEGLTHADVGMVLDISPNAAAIRLHRARAHLEREMGTPSVDAKGMRRIRTWLRWKGSASSAQEREEAR
jgi:RNA polymerase sigma-70 factor (ECF subfamily)